MASIMDSFRNAFSGSGNNGQQPPQGGQQQQTPGAGNPGNMPDGAGTNATTNTNTTAGNGVVPVGAADNEPKAPLDAFADIWKTDAAAGKANEPFSFNVDPAKLMEAAGKIDFAKVVGPETLAKISAGGPEAAAAFADALNKVTQQSFAQSAFASSKMVEQAVAKTRESMEANLPSMIKQQQFSNSLREDNPAFNHPAAAPVIQALEQSLQVKYPNASVNELKDMAKNYFSSLGEAFNPKVPSAAEVAKTKNEVNWDDFLK
jgi:hypothetical protein